MQYLPNPVIWSRIKWGMPVKENTYRTISRFLNLFRPEGNGMLYSKYWKEKTFQSRIFYMTRLSFRFEEEIKSFLKKQKLKEFIATKLTIQEILKKKNNKTSLSWKERAFISRKHENKNLTGKGKFIVKALDLKHKVLV